MWFAVSTVIAYHIGILDQNPMLGTQTFPCGGVFCFPASRGWGRSLLFWEFVCKQEDREVKSLVLVISLYICLAQGVVSVVKGQ